MDQSNNQNPVQSTNLPQGGIDPNNSQTASSMPPAVNQAAPATQSVPQPIAQPTTPPDYQTQQQNPQAFSQTDPALQQAQPQITPTSPSLPVEKGGNGKKIILLVVIFVLLVSAGVAVYFFVIKKKTAEPMTVTPSPTPSPIEEVMSDKEVGDTPEEQEVIDIEDVSVDETFKEIDQNLQQL